RVPPAWRAPGVRGAARAGRDALALVRDLLRVRALRERAAARGERGVPELGEVRGQGAAARRAAAPAREAVERDPPWEPRAAMARQPRVPRDRAGAVDRVRQAPRLE